MSTGDGTVPRIKVTVGSSDGNGMERLEAAARESMTTQERPPSLAQVKGMLSNEQELRYSTNLRLAHGLLVALAVLGTVMYLIAFAIAETIKGIDVGSIQALKTAADISKYGMIFSLIDLTGSAVIAHMKRSE